MNTNNLIHFLADHAGKLECHKDDTGAIVATVTVTLDDGTEVKAVGGQVDSLISSLQGAFERYTKNRDVVPLTTE